MSKKWWKTSFACVEVWGKLEKWEVGKKEKERGENEIIISGIFNTCVWVEGSKKFDD